MTAADRAAQVGRKQENRGQGGPVNIVEGLFDQLRLNTKRSLWCRFSDVTYTYEIYDSESQQVVEVQADFFEAIEHYIASTNGRFWCSSTAKRSAPCYGCSHRAMHYEWVSREEAKTPGVKLADNKRRAPISASNRIIIPVTVCETHLRLAALDESGAPKMSARGNPIFNWVPLPIAKLDGREDQVGSEEGSTKKGLNTWWNLPQTVLETYVDLVTGAKHYCKNCPPGTKATQLVYRKYKCENCGSKHDYDEPIIGATTEDPETLYANFRCPSCKHKGPRVPIPSCPTCKHGRKGSHLDFDYRLKRKELGENMWTFDITDMRTKIDVPEFAELASKPLDIQKICGPTPMARQEKIMPERARAQAGSRRHIRDVKDKTESYTKDSSDNMYDDKE